MRIDGDTHIKAHVGAIEHAINEMEPWTWGKEWNDEMRAAFDKLDDAKTAFNQAHHNHYNDRMEAERKKAEKGAA